MRIDGFGVRRIALAALACLALAGPAQAQGDGPHNLPLVPKDMNLSVVTPMGLSGNFNPSQTVLIPGANVDVVAVPVTYIRTFSLGGRFGRVFVTAPLATLDASGTVLDPRTGDEMKRLARTVGVDGPDADPARRARRCPGSYAGRVRQTPEVVPDGRHRGHRHPDRDLRLNRRSTWAPTGGRSGWGRDGDAVGQVHEMGVGEHVFLFTNNDDVFGPSTRSQNPLFISENHVTHAFDPKWWASVDLRWQIGGETHTDGVPDDNLTNILGGGATLGHASPRLRGYVSYGTILASSGNADEWMVRAQLVYSF